LPNAPGWLDVCPAPHVRDDVKAGLLKTALIDYESTEHTLRAVPTPIRVPTLRRRRSDRAAAAIRGYGTEVNRRAPVAEALRFRQQSDRNSSAFRNPAGAYAASPNRPDSRSRRQTCQQILHENGTPRERFLCATRRSISRFGGAVAGRFAATCSRFSYALRESPPRPINIGFAALTMNHELGSRASSTVCVGIFFGDTSCSKSQQPDSGADGARRWIARILITWGIVSLRTGLCRERDAALRRPILVGSCGTVSSRAWTAVP